MDNLEKPYDLSMLREMESEEPGTLVKIVEIFLESIPEVLTEFMKNFRENDIASLGSSAHKLKSSIDLLSLTEISGLLKQIELSAKKSENLDEIPKWVEKVNKDLNHVFVLLKEEIA